MKHDASTGGDALRELRAAEWVIVAFGEGAQARIIFEGEDVHQAVHDFMCVCGRKWKECSTEGLAHDAAQIDDDDAWTFDEDGQKFSTEWEHETGKIILCKVTKLAPPLIKQEAETPDLQWAIDFLKEEVRFSQWSDTAAKKLAAKLAAIRASKQEVVPPVTDPVTCLSDPLPLIAEPLNITEARARFKKAKADYQAAGQSLWAGAEQIQELLNEIDRLRTSNRRYDFLLYPSPCGQGHAMFDWIDGKVSPIQQFGADRKPYCRVCYMLAEQRKHDARVPDLVIQRMPDWNYGAFLNETDASCIAIGTTAREALANGMHALLTGYSKPVGTSTLEENTHEEWHRIVDVNDGEMCVQCESAKLTKEYIKQIGPVKQRPAMPKFKRAVCRGCYALGSACGKCERCAWERSQITQQPMERK